MAPSPKSRNAKPPSKRPLTELPRALHTEVRKGIELAQSHGHVRTGKGMVSGLVALFLANFSLLGVLVFQFPTYLTTPKVREFVSLDQFRMVLVAAILACAAIAVHNLVRRRLPRLAGWSLFWLAVALLGSLFGVSQLGQGWLPSTPIQHGVPYLGIDWLILDLAATTLVFTTFEKLRPLRREQPVFRRHWQTDFLYFLTGHLLVGLTLLLAYGMVYGLTQGIAAMVPAPGSWREWFHQLPFGWALLLLMLITDLARYWLHRFYHETRIGWRLHSIHHSATDMDWISGSRTHGIETVLSTAVILAPALLLGFSQSVVQLYILIAGFQAVFNHTNVSVRLGPLRYLIVTPNFHHWHHSQDAEALDRCYAAHFAFWDYLFGTAVKSDKRKQWPYAYGVLGDYVPQGFWAQQLYPFVGPPAGVDELAPVGKTDTGAASATS
jgi:sterol desaturase/sphingolipid hydroxylase (fatty acid hydroxylase superfamily)